MFEKAARCWSLALFLACALSLMIVMAALGGFLGVAVGHATLLLLWTLAPRVLAGASFRAMGGFDLCGGALGALASAFLGARFCWRHAKANGHPHIQDLARRAEKLARSVSRRP